MYVFTLEYLFNLLSHTVFTYNYITLQELSTPTPARGKIYTQSLIIVKCRKFRGKYRGFRYVSGSKIYPYNYNMICIYTWKLPWCETIENYPR